MNDDFQMKDEYDFSKGVRGLFYMPKKVFTQIRLDRENRNKHDVKKQETKDADKGRH